MNWSHRSTKRQTTHIQLPDEITVQRVRHPHDGKVLKVIKWAHRGGVLHCLVVLPDRSTMYVPAEWTDFGTAERNRAGLSMDNLRLKNICIGSVSDLKRMRRVVDSLLNPPMCLDHAVSGCDTEEGDNRAIEAEPSGRKACATTSSVARSRSGRPNSIGSSARESTDQGSRGNERAKKKRRRKR